MRATATLLLLLRHDGCFLLPMFFVAPADADFFTDYAADADAAFSPPLLFIFADAAAHISFAMMPDVEKSTDTLDAAVLMLPACCRAFIRHHIIISPPLSLLMPPPFFFTMFAAFEARSRFYALFDDAAPR